MPDFARAVIEDDSREPTANAAQVRAYYWANPEYRAARLASYREYHRAHREAIRERMRAYYERRWATAGRAG